MKERPILFSGPMVRALLEGRKTQTRRIVKPQPPAECGIHYALGNESWLDAAERTPLRHSWEAWHGPLFDNKPAGYLCGVHTVNCPYGQPGDRLRVKEHAWMFCERRPNGVTKTGRPKWHYVPLRAAPVLHCEAHPNRPTIGVVHPETGNEWGWRKKLGRFLPSWASRITLELTSVRVERLQDISENDAKAEGACCVDDVTGREVLFPDMCNVGSWRRGYRNLWESINGAGSWDANPWVWVLEFKRITS